VSTYRLCVFEVLQNQTPIQALRANQPLLDKDVKAATQFIWNPGLSFLDSTIKKYVWTIQTLNAQGTVIAGETSSGQGISEPNTFTIAAASTSEITAKKEEE
jgi:hypothetical protein